MEAGDAEGGWGGEGMVRGLKGGEKNMKKRRKEEKMRVHRVLAETSIALR